MQKSLYTHISQVLDDPIVTCKKCAHCSLEFAIFQKDMEFYKKVSPTFDGKIYLVPPPTLCPDCRQRRRLAFHNERKLHKRTCDATGKEMISIYHPDSEYTVYHHEYWWSDNWNPLDYGQNINWDMSFFKQFGELMRLVPRQSIIANECENSEYLNFVYRVKNCYLISAASFDEDCYYGNRVTYSRDCIDTFLVKKSENCFQCRDTFESYNCQYSNHIYTCNDSYFLKNCEGCSDCFLCENLRNKQYYIQNIPHTEDEYFLKIKKYLELEGNEFEKIKEDFFDGQIKKSTTNTLCDTVFGNNIKNGKRCVSVFDGDTIEEVKYSAFVDDVHSSQDINYGYGNTVLQYECLGTGEQAYQNAFSINIWPNVHDIYYSDTCMGSHHVFLCTGLRNASYCILNKQYTKEEYEVLVPKIIEKMREDSEWGEFFPASLSPFGYNETVANEYYPITSSPTLLPVEEGSETFREAIIGPPSPTGEGMRVKWSLYESPFPKVEKVIKASLLPEDITQIPDDILNWAIECEVTKKPFRIIRQELEFYRKHNIPIPRRHPDQRHLDRMKQRNPRKLFERNCDCCKKPMITTYSPERPETVYCEECYDREIIG